ncbi:MAG: hypothetical protein LQ350_008636 [Teloschistes chrysophthalmus]|nr:MAG: hypothetical protein LQ350_008636 [Niorma chrysophthalma]
MHLLKLALRMFLALLVKGAIAMPDRLAEPEAPSLEKRLVCSQDNVLRALQANSAAASPFCVTFGHIPIPTITVPVRGVTPTVTTVSSYYGKSYFPGGRYLESIAVPSYLSQYSATRVSSGCSCLVTSSTSTVTAAPTMTTTVTNTVTTTLSDGPCGGTKTIPGGHTVTAAGPVESVVHYDYDADAYTCCIDCLIQIKGDCGAWDVVPGVSCTQIKTPSIYLGARCADGPLNGTIGVNLTKYPDALAALGPCAGTINTVQD